MRESAPGRTLRCCPCQHGLSSAAQTGTRRVGQWARAVLSSTKSDCPQQAIQVMILLMQMLRSSPAGADSPHNHAAPGGACCGFPSSPCAGPTSGASVPSAMAPRSGQQLFGVPLLAFVWQVCWDAQGEISVLLVMADCLCRLQPHKACKSCRVRDDV